MAVPMAQDLSQNPKKSVTHEEDPQLPCWPGHGGAMGAPQGLCLEEPPVLWVFELSSRLWVFPFAHEALAVAEVGGGPDKEPGFCRKT